VSVTHFFFGQSIGIDETNTFQLTFFSSMKIVGATSIRRFVGVRVAVVNFWCINR